MPSREEWWERERKKHPNKTDDEIRAIFAEHAKRRKIRGTGGFYGNAEKAAEAGKKGLESRWKKK